jgi:hypothetical protein
MFVEVTIALRIPHDPLYLELERVGVPGHAIPRIMSRLLLFRPVAMTVRGFDEDMAACLLKSDANAKWSDLSYAERQRAKRSWKAFGRNRVVRHHAKRSPTAMGPRRSGRPTVIDPAILLYCVRILCETSGRTDFPLWRDVIKDELTGPMWPDLIAIFPLMQSYVAARSGMEQTSPHTISRHAEAIAGDIKLAKSDEFRYWCKQLGLGPTAEDVANNADTFRLAFALSRKVKRDKRQSAD